MPPLQNGSLIKAFYRSDCAPAETVPRIRHIMNVFPALQVTEVVVDRINRPVRIVCADQDELRHFELLYVRIRIDQLQQDLIDVVVHEVVPPELLDERVRYFINPTGRFVVGGPMGDAGLTGRKIIVDTYGGIARHGGGAFSGKDPTKVDRSGAYGARYVAKNVVAAGLADRLEFQLSYAIGVAQPTSIAVETFDTGRVSDKEILSLIQRHFDLRPGAIIRDLDLRRPIFRATSYHGHFGRAGFPWEVTDKAEALSRSS